MDALGATTTAPYNDLGAAVESKAASSDGEPFGRAVIGAGFNLKSAPAVKIPARSWLETKSTFPAVTDLARRSPVVVPQGYDRRFVWPNMPRTDLGDDLSIQDFTASARTLTGTVERSPTAITDKATVDVTLTLANEAAKQLAVVMSGIPAAILASVDGIESFFDAEARFQVDKALDQHIFAQIVASAPPFGTTGANLVAQVRNGIASMRAEGANPDLLIINPTDAAALDLHADASGAYLFGVRDTGASPLWGVRVVERTSTAGTEPPYLLDTRMLGVLFNGDTDVMADPFGANFKRNLVDLRVELNVLYHVRNAKGARRIAAT